MLGAFEVPPFADEDGCHVELLGDDAQVAAESKPDLLRGAKLFRNRVQSRVEGVGAVAHRLVEQVVLRVDVGVERPFRTPIALARSPIDVPW